MSRNLLTVLVAAALGPLQAHAGMSLQLTPGNITTSLTDPQTAQNQSWRVEFQMHNWTLPTTSQYAGTLFQMSGLGAEAAILTYNTLRFQDDRDITTPSVCDLPLAGRSNVLVRLQRDTTAMRFVCEIWNSDGSAYAQSAVAINSTRDWPYSGGALGGAYTSAQLGFFHEYGTIVADASRPPVTASTEPALALFNFDGNTTDSSGNDRILTYPGATFAATPGQAPAAILRTGNAPAWSTWVSLRAGFPAVLDASQSFSLADASAAVTYAWKQVSGPTTLAWSSQSVATPTVRGLVFGTYAISLTVTDAAKNTATTTLSVGSVSTDDNGVVVQANPAADRIFGPMIAFGKNPWPWEDQMTLHSATVRSPEISAISPPGWATNPSGSVSFTPASGGQPNQTTLAKAAAPGDMTITLTDRTVLDFTTLPTVIIIHTPNVWNPIEEVRICGTNGNVLTVCYDGRGWRAGEYNEVTAPQAWPAGSTVRQILTSGTGTKFLTDFCPAGIGEGGAAAYSAGSVSLTPNSTTVTGASTAWDGSLVGLRIRVNAKHSGLAFVFFATVMSVNSPSSLTINRVFPADATAGAGLTYSVLQAPKQLVRGWTRPDGTAGRDSVGVSSCESNTKMYHSDLFSAVIGAQTNQKIGYQNSYWFSEYGPNYYDEVLAHYAGYYRSGYSLFLDNARKIGDYLPTAPDFDEGWNGILPRRVGATGLVAAAVLDGRTSNWYSLRRLAANAVSGQYSGGAIVAPCDSDLRESAYGLSWIALAAMFDPTDTGDPNTPNQRSYWKAQLANALTRDQGCKGANSEFPTAYWGGSGTYNLTTGSATVTGTGISRALCPVAATGTISVTNSLTTATGTGFAQNAKIVIIGKRSGQPYLFYSAFQANSSSSITMASPYDGDSGTYSYQIETDNNWLAFGSGSADHTNINTLYACQWVSATSVQLDRPWQGATGTYQAFRSNELGYGTQPFFAGIKTLAMRWAADGSTGSTSTGYAALASSTANWIMNTGFDPATGGLNYGREFAGCEPKLNPRLNCTYGTDPASKEAARTLNAEAQNALRVAYEANPTATLKTFGDEFYGAQWGKLGGPYSDSVYLTALDSDATWCYKWLGFLFGVGMAHQWPAVRLGGVMPAAMVTAQVAYTLPAGATSAQIVVTQPSSAVTTYACSGSPCQISADARQGAHWYQVQYLNSSKAVVSSGSPVILETR